MNPKKCVVNNGVRIFPRSELKCAHMTGYTVSHGWLSKLREAHVCFHARFILTSLEVDRNSCYRNLPYLSMYVNMTLSYRHSTPYGEAIWIFKECIWFIHSHDR